MPEDATKEQPLPGRSRHWLVYFLVAAILAMCGLWYYFRLLRQPDYKALIEAASRGDEASLDSAIKHGADPSVFNELNGRAEDSPLHLAAQQGHTNIVRILLSQGMMVDLRLKTGVTPLMLTAIEGKTETASFLIDHGADVNAVAEQETITPLLAAANMGKAEMVTFLIQQGCESEYYIKARHDHSNATLGGGGTWRHRHRESSLKQRC
jgi:ankyrin repeat protein